MYETQPNQFYLPDNLSRAYIVCWRIIQMKWASLPRVDCTAFHGVASRLAFGRTGFTEWKTILLRDECSVLSFERYLIRR